MPRRNRPTARRKVKGKAVPKRACKRCNAEVRADDIVSGICRPCRSV